MFLKNVDIRVPILWRLNAKNDIPVYSETNMHFSLREKRDKRLDMVNSKKVDPWPPSKEFLEEIKNNKEPLVLIPNSWNVL